jgi:hypothetical protein
MAGGLVEWRVDDRIFDDDLTHNLSCRADRAVAQALRPELFDSNLGIDSDYRVLQINDSELQIIAPVLCQTERRP